MQEETLMRKDELRFQDKKLFETFASKPLCDLTPKEYAMMLNKCNEYIKSGTTMLLLSLFFGVFSVFATTSLIFYILLVPMFLMSFLGSVLRSTGKKFLPYMKANLANMRRSWEWQISNQPLSKKESHKLFCAIMFDYPEED